MCAKNEVKEVKVDGDELPTQFYVIFREDDLIQEDYRVIPDRLG